MADRQEREIKEPKRFCTEFSAYTPVKKANPQRKDTKLYDIEVTEVDKTTKSLKIYYVGYSSRFDEWRPFGEDEGSEYFPFFLEAEFFFFRITSKMRLFLIMSCIPERSNTLLMMAKRTD